MGKYYVTVTVAVESEWAETAEEEVRNVLNICTEPDSALCGFEIEDVWADETNE